MNPPADPLNPNYTRSYGYTIEPTTHTGILATYKVCDVLSMSAGVADSVQCGITPDSASQWDCDLRVPKDLHGFDHIDRAGSFGAMKGATLNCRRH